MTGVVVVVGSSSQHLACFSQAVWCVAARPTGTITGPCATTYRLFKLASCRPSQSAATVSSVDDLSAGKIEVKIDRVVNTGRHNQLITVQAAAPTSDAADKKLPEGKKVRNSSHESTV